MLPRIILLGFPGAGKGTQAEFFASYLNIPKISTGDMLRLVAETETPLGLKVKKTMETGDLVSDEIMITLVKNRVALLDCHNGYLLDGFPRTIMQSNALCIEAIKINLVIEIEVPEEEIIKRITGRLFHPSSGRTYHRYYNPPKVENKDDVTGESLIQRMDDSEEIVSRRLLIYRQQTSLLGNYYLEQEKSGNPRTLRYFRISGLGSVEEVRERILKILVSCYSNKYRN